MEKKKEQKDRKSAQPSWTKYRQTLGRKVMDTLGVFVVVVAAIPILLLVIVLRAFLALLRHCKRPFVVRDWRDG